MIIFLRLALILRILYDGKSQVKRIYVCNELDISLLFVSRELGISFFITVRINEGYIYHNRILLPPSFKRLDSVRTTGKWVGKNDNP